jgi:hypothetical protein
MGLCGLIYGELYLYRRVTSVQQKAKKVLLKRDEPTAEVDKRASCVVLSV